MPPTETPEQKAKREADEKAKRDAEEKAKKDAEAKAQRDAEEKAKKEAEVKAKRDQAKAKKGKKDPAKLVWEKFRIAKGLKGEGETVRAACLSEDTHIRTPRGVHKAKAGDYLVVRKGGERFTITKGEFEASLAPVKG